MQNVGRKELSSKVLTMKFMLKNQEDQTRAKLEEERKKAELAAQWTVAVGESIEPTRPKFQYESSFMSFIEDAGEIQLGRQSFNSFNTAIESETTDKIKSAKLNQAMENEAKNFIDDNEMTNIMRGNGKQQGKKRKQGGGKTPPKKSKT